MTRKPGGRNNAFKHGAFAEAVILPGEDINEFKELHQSLINEWKPEGPTEHDAVLSLAKCMWRKRRFARYQQNEVARLEKKSSELQRLEKESDEDLKLLFKFSDDTQSGVLGPITEQNLSTKLGEQWADYFRSRFPRKNYDSDSAWLSAVMHEIDYKLTPELFKIWRKSSGVPKVDEVSSNEERMARELAMEERIDAMIDKIIKRLGQIKTLKEIVIGNRHASFTNEPLKKIESPASQAA